MIPLANLKKVKFFLKKPMYRFEKDPTFERFEKFYHFSLGNLDNFSNLGHNGNCNNRGIWAIMAILANRTYKITLRQLFGDRAWLSVDIQKTNR